MKATRSPAGELAIGTEDEIARFTVKSYTETSQEILGGTLRIRASQENLAEVQLVTSEGTLLFRMKKEDPSFSNITSTKGLEITRFLQGILLTEKKKEMDIQVMVRTMNDANLGEILSAEFKSITVKNLIKNKMETFSSMVSGNTITLTKAALHAGKNMFLGNLVYSKRIQVKVGSISFTSTNAEHLVIQEISVEGPILPQIKNVKLFEGSKEIRNKILVSPPYRTTFSLDDASLILRKSTTMNLDIYGDIPESTSSFRLQLPKNAVRAHGLTSGISVLSAPIPIDLQNITIQ